MRKFMLIIKRIFDILVSALSLVILSPFLIIIAVIIKITSRGPVLFKQKRLGKAGKVFNIYKFRTMIVGAQKKGDGIFVKSIKASRITTFGKFLRSTSLDELPQLINILNGSMSLIGPRPPLPEHPYIYSEYNKIQKKRFEMRPGMTGLAQIKVRNSVPWDERIVYDVRY